MWNKETALDWAQSQINHLEATYDTTMFADHQKQDISAQNLAYTLEAVINDRQAIEHIIRTLLDYEATDTKIYKEAKAWLASLIALELRCASDSENGDPCTV